MTSRNEFIKLVAGLRAAYPSFKLINDEAGFEMWYRMLNDIPYQILSTAVQTHISNNKYPPSIAEIRQIATNPGPQKDWSEGWGIVRKAISSYGQYQICEALQEIKRFDEIAYKVVRRLDFKELCLSENLEVSRANFRMAYINQQKNDMEYKTLPKQLQDELKKIERKLTMETITNQDMELARWND